MAGSHGPDPENLKVRFGSRGATQFMGYASPELDAALAEGARTADLRGGRRPTSAPRRSWRGTCRWLRCSRGSTWLFRRGVRGLPQVEARGLVPDNDYSLVRVDAARAREAP